MRGPRRLEASGGPWSVLGRDQALVLAMLCLGASQVLAVEVCGATPPSEHFLDEAVAAVKALPSGFDTDRNRRDDYLVTLVRSLVEAGDGKRAARLAEAISGQPKQPLVLGIAAAGAAAGGSDLRVEEKASAVPVHLEDGEYPETA